MRAQNNWFIARETGQQPKIAAYSPNVRMAQSIRPKLPLGVLPLGRDRQRLLDLWLETAEDDSVSRRICNDCRMFSRCQRVVDVAREHHNHVRHLLAGETG